MSDSDGDGVYAGVYESFDEAGVYRLVVYAEDEAGNLSQPGVLEAHKVYLPLVLKDH